MPKCEQCGEEVELPFECNFCGHYFCMDHRLPENHNCPNQPSRTPLGSWQTRKEIASIRAEKETRSNKFASEGDLHFVKKKLLSFETKKEKTKRKWWKRQKKEDFR